MDGVGNVRISGLRAPTAVAPAATPVENVANSPNPFNVPGATATGNPLLADLLDRFRGGSVLRGEEGYRPAGGDSFRSRTAADVALRYGVPSSGVHVDPNNPSGALGELTRREIARYDQLVVPAQQELINSLYDTSIVDDAKANAGEGFDAARARAERHRRRYGLRATGAAEQEAVRASQRQEALDYDSSVNEARIEQKTRNDNIRRDLIDVGRGIAANASSGLGAAADNQSYREAAADQARTQRRAQNQQTATALATTVLTYVLAAY